MVIRLLYFAEKHRLARFLAACFAFVLCASLVLGADSKTGTLAGSVGVKGGVAKVETLVYLEGITGNYSAPSQVALVRQKNKVFIPHLLPIQKGQSVKFSNLDHFSHNVHVYYGRKSLLNLAQGIGATHSWTPPSTGRYLVLCNLHLEMSALIFVFDHPFFAVINPRGPSAGQFKIEGIPAGAYTLVAVRDVHGKLQTQKQKVTVKAGGQASVSISF